MRRRTWYASWLVLPQTVFRTLKTLRAHKLGVLMPFFVVLVLLSVVLWMISAIAPLAPFVYSLF